MKRYLVLPGILAMAILLAFSFREEAITSNSRRTAEFKKKNIIRCSPDWNELKDWIEEVDIPPMPGAGVYKWTIKTRNDSAQFYFNQGINMYYGFHIIEAMASFKKAAKLDPDCAMLQWAQALAYGPNINDVGYAASPDALSTSRKAMELSANCSEKEKLLIEAQLARYSEDSTISRASLNQVYVDKMKAAYQKYPGDADIATLYADAMMLQHPWELWKPDGTPHPWTPHIREVLEKTLAKTPNHPGANHYYIHVMEPSPFAGKALASADRLGRLNPGLSHLVHMPSHIYLRTGQYEKGVTVNEKAVNSYKQYTSLFSAVAGNDFLYIIHNLHMQTNNAMMAGKAAYSMKSAQETVNSIQKDYLSFPGALGNVIQYIYMTPTLAGVRFGKWTELINAPQPDKSMVYASLLYHFGKGMAFANTSKINEAKDELRQLAELMKDTTLTIPFSPFSAAIEGAKVAQGMLTGTIALKEKKYTDAIKAFDEATTTEERMVYNEPRDWMLNPAEYLGNAYYQAGQYDNAIAAFNKDMRNNNENGWSLMGTYKALMAQKKNSEADKVLARYKKAFSQSDIIIETAVY